MYKLILAALLLPVGLQAQNKTEAALSVANREFNSLRFAYAIPFFKSHLKKHPEDTAALTKLAYCFKINNQYDSAICYYEKASQLGSVKGNILPELYASAGNYTKAIPAYQSRLSDPNSGVNTKVAKERIEGFSRPKVFMKDSLDYTLYYLSINTPLNEFNAALYDNGFVFESNRGSKVTGRSEFGWDGTPFSKLYYQPSLDNIRTDSIQQSAWTEKKLRRSLTDYTAAMPNDNVILNPKFDFKQYTYTAVDVPLFSKELNKGVNVGAISFANQGKVAYFTRNRAVGNGVSELEICRAERTESGAWTNITPMPFNQKAYSYFHPAVTPDDKRLYFSTDQPGGLGGADIYYVERTEDGKWSDPINAGGVINTAANELFPTYYEGTLYFSSNGHAGLGGLDIYRVNTAGKVENLGYPVNSSSDDFGFSKKGNTGFFNSNRYGSDDIFEYAYKKALVQLSGKATINQNAGKDVRVRLYDAITGQLLDSTVTDQNGNYRLTVRPNQAYKIVVDDRNGHETAQQITAESYRNIGKGVYSIEQGVLDVPVPVIAAKEEEKKPVADATQYIVYYELDKADIRVKDKLVLDSLIGYLKRHPAMQAVVGSFTDCAADEKYNIRLSNKRSVAVKQYLLRNNIPASQIVVNHYGKKYLVQDCSDSNYNSEQQQVNRRSEIFVTDKVNSTWEDLHKTTDKALRFSSENF
ncbi:MAG: OmpA family protein [Chitinophagaceae bacterium]|nr:OmpA family protein [Chitinophagaceae bacterium]MCA6451827.1 OmpA family protein [Chitinophagaceae bacterium]MCA6455254.1 OmpA family protein [Chitinophagaceae bacterium]MCA6460054.1 OmpA family protein [Chitinophagaceae bacterium]MCA6465407.1 OmpA family protein [Chitinophagaceae bacterium]